MCQEFKDQIADPDFEGYCHCIENAVNVDIATLHTVKYHIIAADKKTIVFAREPFVACFASCQSDIPEFENFIRQTTRSLVEDIDPELRVCERMEDC